jgi:hypothetical protein
LTHISVLLYIALLRYTQSIAVGAYLVASLVWVYWILDRQLFFGSDVAAGIGLGVAATVHLGLGFVLARWWALALPFVPVLLAAPIGYPSANRGEPLPIWLGLLLWAPVAIALVAIGIGARLAIERRRKVAT